MLLFACASPEAPEVAPSLAGCVRTAEYSYPWGDYHPWTLTELLDEDEARLAYRYSEPDWWEHGSGERDADGCLYASGSHGEGLAYDGAYPSVEDETYAAVCDEGGYATEALWTYERVYESGERESSENFIGYTNVYDANGWLEYRHYDYGDEDYRNYEEFYTYDDTGRVTAMDHVADSSAWTYRWDYDAAGRVARSTFENSAGIDEHLYAYDGLDRLRRIDTVYGRFEPPRLALTTYAYEGSPWPIREVYSSDDYLEVVQLHYACGG